MPTPRKIPLTIISGFLGSGKTSLLNHLLTQADGRRITAMVNDFGALNIDAELIAEKHGNQIALTNGCVCCSIGDDLMRTFIEVMQQDPLPEHIIIEASGVAEPTRIAGFASVDPQMRLDGIVTLVDASAHHLHSKDPHLADNYAKQIAAAHLLVISKTDLADAETLATLRDELRVAYPQVPLAEATHGHMPIDAVLGLNADAPHDLPSGPPSGPMDHNFVQWAGHLSPVPRHEVIKRLETLRPHVLRAKGILTDCDGAYVIHYAAGRVEIEPFDGDASGHFVLIGTPALPDSEALAQLF